MNNKALMFSIPLIFIALAALIVALHTVTKLENQIAPSSVVAQRPFEILKSSLDSDVVKTYLDQSARFSSANSIDILSKNGGFAEISESCGGTIQFQNKKYTAWNTPENAENPCFPDYYNSFVIIFNKELNDYIIDFNALEKAIVPIDNYDFFIKNTELHAIATQPLNFPIFAPGEKIKKKPELEEIPIESTAVMGILPTVLFTYLWTWEDEIQPYITGAYSVKPSFTLDIGYDLKVYNNLKEVSAKITANCANQFIDLTKKQDCVNNVIKEYSDKNTILTKYMEDSLKGTALLIEILQEPRQPIYFALYIPNSIL